jgi:hypothetical protein
MVYIEIDGFYRGHEGSRTRYCMLRKSDDLFECFYIEIDGFIEAMRGVERGTACSEKVKIYLNGFYRGQ